MVLSYVAQAARGLGQPIVPQREVDKGRTIAERFMIRWKGEPDPEHVKAIDAYWSLGGRARHERLDLHRAGDRLDRRGRRGRALRCDRRDERAAARRRAVAGARHDRGGRERDGDAAGYVKELLDSGERLMGFGHRVYRAEDPRARVLRRTARELDAPRYEVAEALEKAALAELRERRPDRVLETNVEFWAAIVLDFAEVPAHMFTSMFTCARTGGWCAHILEQKRTGRLIRPVGDLLRPGVRGRPTPSRAGTPTGRSQLSGPGLGCGRCVACTGG